MLLLMAAIGLPGIRLLLAAGGEGWMPEMALIAGLGLVAGALIEILRAP